MRLIVLLLATFFTVVAGFGTTALARPSPCGLPGEWRHPIDGAPVADTALFDRLIHQSVVLLGEQHDSAEDHRWQLHTLVQLHARQPKLAIGLEMFPRRLQPLLDDWVAGKLAEDDFLKKTDWDKVWGYDAALYLPLFHFARMQRLPLLALNVERSLPDAIGKLGWEAVPEAQKEGVTRPAAPSPAYLEELQRVFDHHPAKEKQGAAAFPRFVAAQTVWDRAMAQGIAAQLQRAPGSLVAVIVGAGHVRNGHGIAHQLRDLGVGDTAALLTWPRAESCSQLGEGFADALYLVETPPENAPRLGVATLPEKAALRVTDITPGSIAEQAGLQKDDRLIAIAGRPVKSFLTLRQAVQRQPPGTWLPLKVKRGEAELELVARFPAAP